jgi:tetratricopeptide (TPR) repeat protein
MSFRFKSATPFFCLLLGAVGFYSFDLSAQRPLPAFDTHFSQSKLGPVQRQESEHFQVSWVHPRDEILVTPLLEHMEAARTLLVGVFGEAAIHPKRKAPIEIFPDIQNFSEVSGLSLARFRATGTIALTLDQRLMILSPRNLASGYSWAETAVHEYIHYLIREISPDHIPIWLHEGVAQLFQGYPFMTEAQLRPSQWGLFKKRRDQMKLLDLKTLREPFPYRETPEEAELAYIQALLFSQWLDQKCGVLSLIRSANQKNSIDQALELCVGLPIPQLEQQFISKVMMGVELPQNVPAVEFYARDFSSTDPMEVEGKRADRVAQNLAQLSSEMFRQGRFRASALQMGKALEETPVAPPSWRRQMAEAYWKAQQAEDSQRVLRELLVDYPDDAGAWFLLGSLNRQKGQLDTAWQAFVNAFFRNPFMEGLEEQIQSLRESEPEKKLPFEHRLPRP